ncbi:MAG: HEAT repeat domain-containing protein [Planctomycetes bacterium]|nr:HEAT repeat domain-containing protein [Planctomycetota bacterium]
MAELFWYWNRDAFLPQPPARAGRDTAPLPGGGTSAASVADAWLVAATAAANPEDRAAALYALGCAGPGSHGGPILERALEDADADVREAALLALGEHAGTRARFRLVREFDDPSRSLAHRRTAALAYGIACAVDGGGSGRALRPFVAGLEDPGCREAACAADALNVGLGDVGPRAGARAADDDGSALAPVLGPWVAGYRAGDPLPALGVVLLAGSTPKPAVAAALAKLLDAKVDPVRYAARAAMLQFGDVAFATLAGWADAPSPSERAFACFAAVGHPEFRQLAEKALQQPALRGIAALGLALHLRRTGGVAARRALEDAARNQRTFAERPLWLLALALVEDPAVGARATAILQDSRAAVALRLAAADVLALPTDADRTALRRAVHLDPEPAVRWLAADGIARHGAADDVRTLAYAVEHAGTAADRAALLVAFGRCRHVSALPVLRRWCQDEAAPAEVRRAAWRGLALWLRHSGPAALARLPRGVAFAYLPSWQLDLADRLR